MAQVTLESVFKIYPGEKGADITAVRDFNLLVEDCEFVVFVGPSGCGKSTTLRMIAGLEEISRGKIFIGDRLVNDLPPKDRDIAMVFQNYALYPHMSVYDNMAFGLKLRKFKKDEIRRRVEGAAEILGLEQLLQRKPKALSGGQRQRVAVGRAIVRQPSVFLFDEPLSNLDAKMRVQMRMEIIKLHQRLEATMIYVTHDQVEAMTMGTRIVVMDAVVNPETGQKEGIVQQIDTPLNLYNHPANLFVAGFLGSPPMNFLQGTLAAENGGLVFHEKDTGAIRLQIKSGPGTDRFAGHKVILGIRPENCHPVFGESTAPDLCDATVDVAEVLGAETYLYVRTGAHTLISRSQNKHHLSHPGDKIRLHLDPAEAHLFDPETGGRITA